MKKLKDRRGESLVELLFATLIISLGVLLLAGSIVTAAKVNRSAANDRILTLADQGRAAKDNASVSLELPGVSTQPTVTVTLRTMKAEGGKELYSYD